MTRHLKAPQEKYKIARETCVNRCLSHWHLLDGIHPLLWIHDLNQTLTLIHAQRPLNAVIIRTSEILKRVELNCVTTHGHRIADGHLDVLFNLITVHEGYSDDKDSDADMSKEHSIVGPRYRTKSAN